MVLNVIIGWVIFLLAVIIITSICWECRKNNESDKPKSQPRDSSGRFVKREK